MIKNYTRCKPNEDAPYFAIFVPADQTILYLTADGGETVKHPDAIVFDTVTAAEHFIDELVKAERHLQSSEFCPQDYFYIENVNDIEEFRSRNDTW